MLWFQIGELKSVRFALFFRPRDLEGGRSRAADRRRPIKGGVDHEAGFTTFNRDIYRDGYRASLSWRAGDLFAAANDCELDYGA